MDSKFSLVKASNLSEWDHFVENSPQGTLFSFSDYLRAVSKKFALFYVYKGQEKKAGVSVMLTDDGKGCELDDFVIYNGLLFQPNGEKKETSARHEKFEVAEFVIHELAKKYEKVEMSLAPQFEDLRPFLWYNYHSKEQKDKWKINLRYTSYIAISELSDKKNEEETKLFKNMETLRQRNIREARKAGASVSVGMDIDLFACYYDKLMFSQDEEVPADKLQRLKKLIFDLIANKRAVMFLAKNSKGQTIYILVFGLDSKRAYYLFGAGDLNAKERYKGTVAFWDAFKILSKKYHVSHVDMEGVNSPRRGWFKLSFGGVMMPYYHIFLHH